MNLSMLLYQAGTADCLVVFDRDRWEIFSKAIPRPAQVFQRGFLEQKDLGLIFFFFFRYINALRFRYIQKGVFTTVREFGLKGPLEVSSPPQKTSLLSQNLVQAGSEYLRDGGSSTSPRAAQPPREGTESWEHSGASELIGFLLHREGKWALLSEAHSG